MQNPLQKGFSLRKSATGWAGLKTHTWLCGDGFFMGFTPSKTMLGFRDSGTRPLESATLVYRKLSRNRVCRRIYSLAAARHFRCAKALGSWPLAFGSNKTSRTNSKHFLRGTAKILDVTHTDSAPGLPPERSPWRVGTSPAVELNYESPQVAGKPKLWLIRPIRPLPPPH